MNVEAAPASITPPARVDAPASPIPASLRWPNRFATLGPAFFTELAGRGLPEPHWVATSDDAARSLGWPADWYRHDPHALAVFSGTGTWPGMRTLASVYSGHQFGSWAGQLGDGRAMLLGEVDTPGGPVEMQLKGAGPTPYSRMGDGRAVLRSSIREFLASEAMHHLGVPTSRGLCLTGSALPVRRERVETAAVVTRLAPSFIRFGHFEHFAHHGKPAELRALADFVIDHFYPACREAGQPVAALLCAVAERTAVMVAHWQSVGFAHGVMNTDNMSILGLTIDYGPFGFLDAFDPQLVCNHSDDRGRYAFSRQPQVAWWNLHALAQALMPLVNDDTALLQAALAPFSDWFSTAMTGLMRAKLGLTQAQDDGGNGGSGSGSGNDKNGNGNDDGDLIDDWLKLLAADRVDYTIAMRRLGGFSTTARADNPALRDLFINREAFDAWAARYTARLHTEGSVDAERSLRMAAVNPKYILRNHLAEQAIRAAEGGDFSEVNRLLKVLSHPFHEQPEADAYAGFPPDWAQHLEVSCSS